jgi:dolichol-phosphate mannosyltransferase
MSSSEPITPNARTGLPARVPLVSLVAPVYCEEELIEEFYRRAKAAMAGLAPKYDHEIVLVNDGSTDRTLEILKALAERDPHLRVASLSRNFGHQLAITAGIDLAAGDAVVIIDSDLQDPPEVVPQMIAKWEEGFKVVYGVRSHRQGESRFKLATASLFYRLMQGLSDTPIPLDAGDFRLVDRAVVEVIKQMREEHRYMRGMMAWAGFRQFGLLYQRDRRYAGQTKYTVAKMVRLAVNAILSFSAKPLYLAGYFGVLVTFVSLLLLAWIVIGKLINPAGSALGWSSLIAVVLFLGGVQLMSIGILGQYVGRLFEQSKQRPLYIVSESYGFGPQPAAADHDQPSRLPPGER